MMNWFQYLKVSFGVALFSGLVAPLVHPEINGYGFGGFVFGLSFTIMWLWQLAGLTALLISIVRFNDKKGEG